MEKIQPQYRESARLGNIMPSLSELVPEIAIFQQQRKARQDAELGQLQQMGALQGIMAKIQAQKEQQQLQGVVQQAGGDPAKAIQALIASANPRAIELAAKLQ